MPVTVQSQNEVYRDLKAAFDRDGIRSAVAFLNSITPYRFTSLYRFEGEMLHNITFYDRDNPDETSCEDIPVEASFCVFVRDTEAVFLTTDSESDRRLTSHPKRGIVKRYCGVPLLDSSGQMFGSICHFDLEPGEIDERDVEALEYMASVLQPGLGD